MIVVIWVKFEDIGGHCHACKSHHHSSNGHENGDKPVVSFGKKTFFGKKISIEQAYSETKINNERRNDTLPPNIAHRVKIRGRDE